MSDIQYWARHAAAACDAERVAVQLRLELEKAGGRKLSARIRIRKNLAQQNAIVAGYEAAKAGWRIARRPDVLLLPEDQGQPVDPAPPVRRGTTGWRALKRWLGEPLM